MKFLFTAVLLTAGIFTTQAQQAFIKFKDATEQQLYITEVDSIYLSTSKGVYPLNEIEEVAFGRRRGKDEHLYYQLSNAAIKVRFDSTIKFTTVEPVLNDAPEDELTQFRKSFQEYKKANQLAAGLQFSGLMLGVIGLLIEEDALIYTGAAASGAGLVLKIRANHHAEYEEYPEE